MLSILLVVTLAAQTTQSVIRGRVINASTGQAIDGALVVCYNPELDSSGYTYTNKRGDYVLTSLSPGNYRLRIEKEGFQARDIYSLELHVTSRMELNTDLRPMAEVRNATPGGVVLRKNEPVLPVLGPDLDLGRSSVLDVPSWKSATLQSALSYVVDPQQTGELPLNARNVYTMIVTLPGVKAEEVTGRGLGISANGQRASSSNFLLDGAENNDHLLTGPFSVIAPEGMQEYRITTSNFSAEYGGAGGYVANAVTRTGSNAFHGLAYTYLSNDALNASTFQQNLNAIRRTPEKQLEAGYWFGGPIRKDRLFFSSQFDRYRSRALGDPYPLPVPVTARFRSCSQQAGVDLSRAIGILGQFPPPEVAELQPIPRGGTVCDALWGYARVERPVWLDRSAALERLDYRSPSGFDRLMARLAISRLQQPRQEFSVYPAFNADMTRNASGVALSYIRSFASGAITEVNASWRNSGFQFERPLHAFPNLTLGFDKDGILPGQYELPYEFTENAHNWAFGDSTTLTHGSHILTFGGGVLLRREGIGFPLLPAATYSFDSVLDFALSRPTYLLVGLSREAFLKGSTAQADPRRRYSNQQFFGFAQDSWKLGPRLTINLGVRYESFGTLTNSGAPDGIVQLRPGADFQQRLATASFTFQSGQPVYPPDRNNWAGRFGLAYSLSARTIFRAGYGLFYDRFYDNLFLNAANSEIPAIYCAGVDCRPATLDYTQPVLKAISGRTSIQTDQYAPPVLIDDELRTPYTQNWFAGIQQQPSANWYLEISHMGSSAAKLITSDLVNQVGSGVSVPRSRINPKLPALWRRSNAGSSSYAALGALARYRSTYADFQASYTWSHSLDNQTEAMLGDLFNLTVFNPENAVSGTPARQFDARQDHGSSDFDIRHNLVFYSVWRLPGLHGRLRRLTNGWQAAQLADFRTGLPYTVTYSQTPYDTQIQSRPDLVSGVPAQTDKATTGGVQLLNAKAFSWPAKGSGTLGRNTFAGPGFWNVDLSLVKAFSLPRLGERRRVEVRADAFNVFNHANLNLPDANLNLPDAVNASPTFGRALYGPQTNASAFPALTPLYPSPRRIQLQVKLYF